MTEFDLYWDGLGLTIPTNPKEVALAAFNAGIELSAQVVDAQAATLKDTAVRLGEVAADAVTISLHDQAATELENVAGSIRARKS